MENIKDKCDEIVKGIQARLSGWDKGAQLHEQIKDKDERIGKLTGEVLYWKSKFDQMWQTWHQLAVETKGKAEADKMAEGIKAGK